MAVTSDAGIDAADRTALKDVLVRLHEVPWVLSTHNDHKTERFICVLSDAKPVVPTARQIDGSAEPQVPPDARASIVLGPQYAGTRLFLRIA